MAHLHQIEGAFDFDADFAVALLAYPQAVGDIARNGHVRPHGIGLKHHRYAALLGRYVAAGAGIEHELAGDADTAGVRLLQAGDGAQGCGLAATRGSKQGDMLAATDLEADAVDGRDVTVTDAEIPQIDVVGAIVHVSSLVMPRVSRNRISRARITVKV